MSSAIEAALDLARQGYPVFPIWHPVNGKCACKEKECGSPGKHPRADLGFRHGVKDATKDYTAIASWPAEINVAVALGEGAAGAMAADIDKKDVADKLLRAGVAQLTRCTRTRRGIHIWFRSTGRTKGFGLRGVGDVRGDGQYVLVPPSATITGRPYRWLGVAGELVVVDDPKAWIKELLTRAGVQVEPGAGTPDDLDKWIPKNKEIEPCDIPARIAKDQRLDWQRLLVTGGVRLAERGDWSKELWKIAARMTEVARDLGQQLTASEVAGAMKKADRYYYDKYNRPEQNDDYWREAYKCLGKSGQLEPSSSPKEPREADYRYDETTGWTVMGTKSGVRRICNFYPRIFDDVRVSRGPESDSEWTWRVWFVRGSTEGMDETVSFTLPPEAKQSGRALEKFMSEHCSSSYVVMPGMYDHLKVAMQILSSDPERRLASATTGWVEHGQGWAYLLPRAVGGITEGRLDPDVRIDRDLLPEDEEVLSGHLDCYGVGVRPPRNAGEVKQAWLAFEQLVECGPLEVTFPIVLQVLAGPIASWLFSAPPLLHILGRTGTLKTSYCQAALSLFGRFDPNHATTSWSSTSNYIGILLHAARDVTVLADDYKRSQADRYHSRLIQNYGDHTGRGRATAGGRTQVTPVPRGMLLSNGEDRWENEASAEARTILVKIKAGDVNPARLTAVQRHAAAGTLAVFGGYYLSWLAGRYEVLEGDWVERQRLKWQQHFAGAGHLRLAASLGSLFVPGSLLRAFVKEHYPKQVPTVERWVEQTATAMKGDMGERAREVEELSPFNQLASLLSESLAGKKVTFTPALGINGRYYNYPDNPGATIIGWYQFTKSGERLVHLSRNITFGWYEEQARRRGNAPNFSWAAVVQEACNERNGQEKVRWLVLDKDGNRGSVRTLTLAIDQFEHEKA